MNDSENKPYFTSFSAKYSALTPDDKEIVINSLNSISDMLLMGRISNIRFGKILIFDITG